MTTNTNPTLKAYELTAKRGPRGRKLFKFIQFHPSIAEATTRGAKILGEDGLILVSVKGTTDPRDDGTAFYFVYGTDSQVPHPWIQLCTRVVRSYPEAGLCCWHISTKTPEAFESAVESDLHVTSYCTTNQEVRQ